MMMELLDEEEERKMKRHKSEADVSRVRFVIGASQNEEETTRTQPSSSRRNRQPNEKTGRWTDEEHTRFLHGLHLFGKKWTKVADIVGTRTTVQVRSHAQKYFQKMEKGNPPAKDTGSTLVSAAPKKSSKTKAKAFPYSPHLSQEASQHHRVPTALKRFLPQNQQKTNAAELAAGIFKFLSPLAVPTETPPQWYQGGGSIKELLIEASELDWSRDHGGVPIQHEDVSASAEALKKKSKKKKYKKPATPSDTLVLPLNDTIDAKETHNGNFSFSRSSSFEALCSVVQAEHRNSSHDSLPGAADFGLFYEEEEDEVSAGLIFDPEEFRSENKRNLSLSVSAPALTTVKSQNNMDIII